MSVYTIYIQGKVTVYGQCPHTYTLGISETIDPTKICLMNNTFIIIYIVLIRVFLIQNRADISLIVLFFKFMKKMST